MPPMAKSKPTSASEPALRRLPKSFRRFLAGFAVTLLMAGLSAPATAASDSDRDAFRQAFAKAVNDPAMLETVTAMADLGAEKTPLFRRYIVEVMTDPAFLNRMTDEIVATGLPGAVTGPETAFETGFSLGYEIVVAITARGLAKMRHEDIHEFFRLMSGMFSIVEPRYCRVMMQQQGATQEAQIETSYAVMRGMDPAQFRAYLSLSKAAIRAELSPAPARDLPSAAQMDLANRAFVMKFDAALMALPDPRGVIASLSAPHAATDMNFCDAGTLMFSVLAEMEGLTGQWMRLAALAAAE